MTAHGRRAAALALSSMLLAGLAGTAIRAALPGTPTWEASRVSSLGPGTPTPVSEPTSSQEDAPEPARGEGSTCRTTIERSRVVAYCHNPYPETDLVQLHAECARWWDVDADGAPVPVEPARTVRLSGRCWQEVDSAWVSHERAPEGTLPGAVGPPGGADVPPRGADAPPGAEETTPPSRGDGRSPGADASRPHG